MFATLRKLLLLVLGIPFLILGARFLIGTANTTLTYWNSASWTPAQANLLTVERINDPDQAWGNQTTVRYSYDFNGQSHTGSSICPSPDCTEPGVYEQLRAARDANIPVPALVNPRQPDRAILFRHLHLAHILLNLSVGLFCIFTGGSAVAFGLYMLYRDKAHVQETRS